MGAWTLAGATVVDGTGSGALTADIVIEGDRIAAIGSGEHRGTIVDAHELVAVPWFVDIHSHVDWIAGQPHTSGSTCPPSMTSDWPVM